MRRRLNVFIPAVLAVLVAMPLAAADNGFYIGGSIGQAAINTGQLGDVDIDNNNTGYKVFAGGRFITFLGIEGSYVDLGTTEEAENEATINGIGLEGMAYLPLGIADIFVKGGMFQWEADLRSAGVDISKDGTDPVYGAGFQFRFQSIAVRGEVEYFDVESADEILMYSAGVSWTF